MNQSLTIFSEEKLSRIIEIAWADQTPFDAISASHEIGEQQVNTLMRRLLKDSSSRLWRKRMTNRSTKHAAKRLDCVLRAYCPTQHKQR